MGVYLRRVRGPHGRVPHWRVPTGRTSHGWEKVLTPHRRDPHSSICSCDRDLVTLAATQPQSTEMFPAFQALWGRGLQNDLLVAVLEQRLGR
jgi:hypothetical protein